MSLANNKYSLNHSPNHNRLLYLPSNVEPKDEIYGSSVKIGLIETNPLHSLNRTPLSKSKGKKPRVEQEIESLEVSLLEINPGNRKLEKLKIIPVKARKTEKDFARKRITIDLDL